LFAAEPAPACCAFVSACGGSVDEVEEGEGGCDTDETKGELLGFEEVGDALEGKVEVYFCFLELDEEGVEEGVGREEEGGEGV